MTFKSTCSVARTCGALRPQVAPLLRCVRCLAPEPYALRGEERALGDTLALAADQLFRHTDDRVAREAAECLVGAATQGPGSLLVRGVALCLAGWLSLRARRCIVACSLCVGAGWL